MTAEFRVRAADNEPDHSRGFAGYVTTYQGIAAAPELHLVEMRRHRTLLVVDEVHHLPGLAAYEPGAAVDSGSPDEASSWSRALLPMLESARVIARATRVDPNAGPYEGQRVLVFHPDDPLFATFRRRVETEQGTLAKKPKAAQQGSALPDWLLDRLAERACVRRPSTCWRRTRSGCASPR